VDVEGQGTELDAVPLDRHHLVRCHTSPLRGQRASVA
jgi:hypothetical protein